MKLSIILLMGLLFIIVPAAVPEQQNGDVNCDDGLNILDVSYIINYLYKGGTAPCEFISPGVAYNHADQVDLDVGYTYSTMMTLPVYAPEDGWIAFDYSFYTYTEVYCLELLLGEVRKDGEIIEDDRDVSYVTAYTLDSPTSWHQVMPIDSGITWFALSVRSCAREEKADIEDEEYTVTFKNVNLSATYFPVYYGTFR